MSKRIWTDSDIQFIITAFKAGHNTKEIAGKFCTKAQTIGKILKANGCNVVKCRRVNRRLIHNYFDTIDSEEKAYFIGLLFTDGSVTLDKDGRSPSIAIELCEEDEEILHQLQYEIQSDGKITHNKRANRENGTVSLKIRSSKMAEDLAKYGIVPNKTYVTERIPTNIPDLYIPDFLRGMIDGDGSIFYSQGIWHIGFTTHFRSVAEDFERLCSRLIGKENQLRVTSYNGIHKVTFNGNDAAKLATTCYSRATIGILRKFRRAVKAMNNEKQVEDIV